MVQRKPFAGGHREFIDALLAGTVRAERLVGTPGALEFDDPEEPDVVAVGGIYQTMSAVNPGAPVVAGGLGYGIWLRIADGRVLIGTTTTSGVESGAATATPTGAVSAPTFTGGVASTSLVSAGTPSGAVSAPTFVGSPLAAHSHAFTGTSANTSLVSAGTPAGTCSAPTFVGAALAAHSHQLPLTGIGGTTPRTTASFGTSGSTVAGVRSLTNAASTTAVARELTQSVSAGTPSGTVSAPTFTGSALGAHQHVLVATGANSDDSAGTPAGSCSAPTFVGTALGTHQHSLTATGTCSAPVFTGAPLALQPPSLSCFTWVRTG